MDETIKEFPKEYTKELMQRGLETVYQSNIFGVQNKIDEIGSHIDRGIENVKSWFENKFKKIGEGGME